MKAGIAAQRVAVGYTTRESRRPSDSIRCQRAFAPAYSGLSDAYLWAGYNEGFITASAAKPKARAAAEKAVQLFEDALALEAAGCFAIVLEAVPAPVAARITEALTVPTIGIGAGVHCDGQVLVWHDLLGLYEGHAPRFVKQYADLSAAIKTAVGTYVEEVRERRFPEEQHTYSIPADELELFEEAIAESVKPS